MAPIYDNGDSLFPSVNTVIDGYMDNQTRYQFLYDRVFTFPDSSFKVKKSDRAHRSNYFDVLGNTDEHSLLGKRANLIRSKFNYKDVFNIIKGIVDDTKLGPEYRRFYVEIVALRYMCLVLQLNFENSYVVMEDLLDGKQKAYREWV
jgi:hypothetical protein